MFPTEPSTLKIRWCDQRPMATQTVLHESTRVWPVEIVLHENTRVWPVEIVLHESTRVWSMGIALGDGACVQ